MSLTMLAFLGVLLLGGGVAILVVNLGRARGGAGTLDQIQTYGYVAEVAGSGTEEHAARRPLDSLAGRIGDVAGRRLNYGEEKIREKLIAAGMYGTTPRK